MIILLNKNTHLHGVCFARASLSICKYTDMVAIDAGCHQRLNLLKDLMKHKVRVFVPLKYCLMFDI